MRAGLGFNSHRLVEGRPLIIGGVKIPHEKGLAGHSDADVLLHAVADALIGAAGLSSIGEMFPDTDSQYEDADSGQLLKEVSLLVIKHGYKVHNLDCTILAEEPRLVSYRDRMRENISTILEIPASSIAIKPKSAEGLGFVGRKEGIAALAVVLIEEVL